MNKQAQTNQRADLDLGPALKLYIDGMESWKKQYENLLQTAIPAQSVSPYKPVRPSQDEAMSSWQKSGQELFKRFVEQQVELCRFFGKRWEEYLALPGQFADCKTPAEAGQMQLAFMNQMAADYAQESAKLMQPMGDLMAKWVSGRHAM